MTVINEIVNYVKNSIVQVYKWEIKTDKPDWSSCRETDITAVFICENTHYTLVMLNLSRWERKHQTYIGNISSTHFGPRSVSAVAYRGMLETRGLPPRIDGANDVPCQHYNTSHSVSEGCQQQYYSLMVHWWMSWELQNIVKGFLTLCMP